MPDFLMFNVNLEFTELFSVQVQHEFFKGNNTSKIRLEPTGESLKLFSRYGLHQKSGNIGTIAGFKKGTDTKDLLLAKEPISLVYQIISEDPAFFQYSDVPFPKENQGFYFSNKKGSMHAGKACLHTGKMAGSADLIPVFQPLFAFNTGVAEGELEWKITDIHGVLVKEGKSLHTGSPYLNVDLRDQTEGVYELEVKGKESFKFFRIEKYDRKAIGLVQIFLSAGLEEEFVVMNETGILPKKFAIYFGARSTRWKYRILQSTNTGLYLEFEIIDPDKKVKFAGAKEEEGSGGKKILFIESSTAIKLNENPKYKFQLNLKKQNGQTLSIELPCADPFSITPGKNGDKEEYYSEIFINV